MLVLARGGGRGRGRGNGSGGGDDGGGWGGEVAAVGTMGLEEEVLEAGEGCAEGLGV